MVKFKLTTKNPEHIKDKDVQDYYDKVSSLLPTISDEIAEKISLDLAMYGATAILITNNGDIEHVSL